MAKIRGPLFSAEAAGNFAQGAMQFRGGLRGTHAYRPMLPGKMNQRPATAAQAAVRERYAQRRAEWQALGQEDKAAWNEEAAGLGMSGWNLFVKKQTPQGGPAPDLNYTAPGPHDIGFDGLGSWPDHPYTAPGPHDIGFPR